MAQLGEMLGFLVLMAAAGAAIGGVSGLLGKGGGLFAPVALYFAFDALGHGGPEGALLAAGTACAVTGLMAVIAWKARGVRGDNDGLGPFRSILASNWPIVIAGILGAAAVSVLGGWAVFALLGATAAVAAVNRAMAAVGAAAPSRKLSEASGASQLQIASRLGAGALSSATGIGGETVLASLTAANVDAVEQARSSAAMGALASVAGVVGYVVAPLALTLVMPTNLGESTSESLPFVLGAVGWGAAFIAAPAALLAAPVGARVARMADRRIIGLGAAALAALIGLTFLREAGIG